MSALCIITVDLHWQYQSILVNCLRTQPPHPHTRTHKQHNTQWGGTALYIAVREEHEDIVDLLLEASAYPDVPDKVIHTCT